MVTPDSLNALVGQSMADICPNGYDDILTNHCAHYVSHVLGLSFGTTCRTMSRRPTGDGANIRVAQVFPRCAAVGRWADRPATADPCLVFATRAANVHLARKSMDNVPQKHVGIFCSGQVWHYSNPADQVVRWTPDEFLTYFQTHYSGSDVSLFYGTFSAAT